MLHNVLCFNKCVFANVSLGENIFLLFLCVVSLGLFGEAQPMALGLLSFLFLERGGEKAFVFSPCPCTYSSFPPWLSTP